MVSRSEQKSKFRRSIKPSAPLGVWLMVWLVVALLMSLAVWALSHNPLYASKSFWLVSRAAAIAAYVMLTITVILGLVLSHPRNKDTWQVSKQVLPWHQALVTVFLALLATHLVFTILDAKSGVLPINILLPLHAHYRPYAMLLGSLGLGLLLMVLLTALWPGVFRSIWMKVHRMAAFIWLAVWLHGLFAGTDVISFYYLYLFTGVMVIGLYLWRHWVRPVRAIKKYSASEEVTRG